MKKSYIKIILFTFTLSLFLLLNSLYFKKLNQIELNILLIITIIITYLLFGFEKDRHRYSKDVTLKIIIILMAFFLLYYSSGILIGFAQNNNYLTVKSIINIILPILIYIPLKEFLRYHLLTKSSESKILIATTCILFILIDNTIPLSLHTITFSKETFLLIALTFLPSITENILCTYLSLHLGYKPGIIYLIIMNLYKYILPIIPNPNEYLYSLIFLILPLIVLVKIKNYFKQDRINEQSYSNYKENKRELISFIPLIILIIVLVCTVSNYFRFYAIAIASGSMTPHISKGDVVIVDKKFKNLEIGDVLAYKYEGKIIVHRVCKIINNNNEYFIYTKGDANKDFDNYKITEDMFIGVVKIKIPLIGYPTVLLNERW
mgnify:CR=1 FL=1